MHEVFASKGHAGSIPTAYALAYLNGIPDRPWKQWRDGEPMTHMDMAAILRDKDIRSFNERQPPCHVIKCYRRKQFVRSWRKVGDSLSSSSARASMIEPRQP